jgi:hypothetical protein
MNRNECECDPSTSANERNRDGAPNKRCIPFYIEGNGSSDDTCSVSFPSPTSLSTSPRSGNPWPRCRFDAVDATRHSPLGVFLSTSANLKTPDVAETTTQHRLHRHALLARRFHQKWTRFIHRRRRAVITSAIPLIPDSQIVRPPRHLLWTKAFLGPLSRSHIFLR